MASLLNWAKKRVQQVENIVHNDVVSPINRDVVQPVSHIAQAAPGFVYHNVAEPIAQTAVQAPIDTANLIYNRAIAPTFHLPNLTPIQTKPISGLSKRVGATGSLHQTLASDAQLAAMLATGGIAGGIEKGIGITAPKLAGTIVPKIASNAALGSGFNALAATAQGAKPKDIVKSAAIGGAVGGAIPVAGAGVKLGAKGVVKLNNARVPLNAVGAVGKNVNKGAGGKSLQELATEFKKQTGDYIDIAATKMGGAELRGEPNPYTPAQQKILQAYENAGQPKPSKNLYHVTQTSRLADIKKNGLKVGRNKTFETSSAKKIYLSPSEEHASYYGTMNSTMLRTKKSFTPSDLGNDYLSGGAYTTGKNISPDQLEVKVKGKWQPLTKNKVGLTPLDQSGSIRLPFGRGQNPADSFNNGNIKPPSLSPEKPPRIPPSTGSTPIKLPTQAEQGSVQKPNMVHGKTPSFTTRVQQSKLTPPTVSENMGGHYIVKPNKQTLARATQEINANPEAAVSRILGPDYKPTTHNHAVAMLLAEKARTAGRLAEAQGNKQAAESSYNQMTNILERVSNEASNPGQAIQILSQWGKSTPTGIVKYAQKVVREGHKLPDGTPTKVLTADQAKTFGNRMEQIQKLPEGRNKNLQTAVLLKDIHSLSPPSAGSKLQNLLYYAQLLNPKTAIRNVGGNTIFGGAENVSDVLGAPIDKALSLITKKRTVYAPDVLGQIKTGVKGAREATQEARLGVNLSGTTGQFEAYGRPPVFNNKVGKGLDTALAVELSTPDRFALTGAQYQSLKNQLRASGIDKKLLTPDKIWAAKQGKDVGIPITQDMLERAGELGKYRTFQDNSLPAKVFTGLKSTLNLDKKFGAGSFVMNYPKTPGNLLARGLDFSPAGFIKTTIELGKPAFGKGFNQEQFVRSLSRATTGSVGLVGTGAALNQLGIITGRPDPSKNANAAQKALGLGQYKINVSALKRFIASGFSPSAAKLRPGDTQVSYDWAQPASFALTMGANINQTKGTNKGTVAKISNSLGKGAGEIVDAMNSLAEQPVLQGLQTLTGSSGAGLTQGLIQTAASAPSGFVPTLFNQINQVLDNTSRSTYSPNPITSGIKKVEAKIPGVASSLQPQVNILGQPAERYQKGTNNLFNVFLNPAFVSKYIPNKVLDETNRLENKTGETGQFPKQIKYTQKVNGKNVPLTPQQVTQLQTYVGQKASDQLGKIIDSPSYQKATDTEKVNMLSSALTNISQAGRAVVLGNKSKLGSNAQAVANNQDIILGGASSPKEKYQQALDTFNRDQSTYSGVKKDKEQQKLGKLKVQSTYSQDVIDLYGESKAKTYQYLTTHNDGKKLASQLQAYDQALYNAGLTSYLKYKNGLAPSARGYAKGGKRGGGSKKVAFSTTGFKTAGQAKAPKIKGVKVKKLSSPKFSTKTKKLSVSKIPSNYLNKKLG